MRIRSKGSRPGSPCGFTCSSEIKGPVSLKFLLFFRFQGAAAGATLPAQGRINDGLSAPDPGPNRDGLNGAVAGTGAALDTGIPVDDLNRAIILGQHLAGADRKAHAATDAFIFLQTQGRYIFQIDQSIHCRPSLKRHAGDKPKHQADGSSPNFQRNGPAHLLFHSG